MADPKNPTDPTANHQASDASSGGTKPDLGPEHRGTLGAYLRDSTKGSPDYARGLRDLDGDPVIENVSIADYMSNYIPVNKRLNPNTPGYTGGPEFTAPDPGISNINPGGGPMRLSSGERDQKAFIKPTAMTEPGNSIINDATIQTHFEEVSKGIFFPTEFSAMYTESSPDGRTVSEIEDGDFKNTQIFGHEISSDYTHTRLGNKVSSVLRTNRFAPEGLGGTEIDQSSAGFSPFQGENPAKRQSIGYETGSPVSGDHIRTGVDPSTAVEKQHYYAGDSADFGRMAKFGRELMLRSTGQTLIADPDEPNDLLAAQNAGPYYFNNNDPFTALGSVFSSEEVKRWREAVLSGGAPLVPGGAMLDEGSIFTGTGRISLDKLNPKRNWMQKNLSENISMRLHKPRFATATGEEVEIRNARDGQVGGFSNAESPQNKSFGQLSDYIDQFHGKLFGKYYRMALQGMTTLFIQNLLTSILLDATISLAYLLQGPKQRSFMDGQIPQDSSNLLAGNQMVKGKSRGTGYLAPTLNNNTDPSKFFGTEGTPATGNTNSVLDLLGVSDVAEKFSGPALAQLILDTLDLPMRVNTRQSFILGGTISSKGVRTGGFQLGKFAQFSVSFFIGITQTFIHAILDPQSGPYFANLTRSVTRTSTDLVALSQSDGLGFVEFFQNFDRSSSFGFFKVFSGIGESAIAQYEAIQRHGSMVTPRGLSSLGANLLGVKPPPSLPDMTYGRTGLNGSPFALQATPSMYILPKSFRDAYNVVNGHQTTLPVGKKDVAVFLPMGDPSKGPMLDSSGRRIAPHTARMMEQVLNASYCPFYIRDMRTNEIISFHAFLDDIQDGFTTNYSEVKGFGRIEAAHIYESTSRQISIGFTMFAMNKEDHDDLYFKLNKLVTLVYPQWSKGTLMRTDTKRFFMPFSQIPTASPLVRLRVGDLITSNYSNQAAMRLLGMGMPETSDPEASPDEYTTTLWRDHAGFTEEDSIIQAAILENIELPGEAPSGNFGNQWKRSIGKGDESFMGCPLVEIEVGTFFEPMENIAKFGLKKGMTVEWNARELIKKAIAGVGTTTLMGNSIALEVTPGVQGKPYFPFHFGDFAEALGDCYKHLSKIYPFCNWGNCRIKTEVVGFGRAHVIDNESLENVDTKFVFLKVKAFDWSGVDEEYNAGEPPDPTTDHGEHVLGDRAEFEAIMHGRTPDKNLSAFKMSSVFCVKVEHLGGGKTKIDFRSAGLDAANAAAVAAMDKKVGNDNRMEDEQFLYNNPFISNFKNTEGSGMAGFLDGLSIDWQLGNFPWEIEQGSRAPLGCKISFTFKPIHDITPGIDADGFNRAPVYKVGNRMSLWENSRELPPSSLNPKSEE